MTTFVDVGVINIQQGELTTFPAVFSSALLLFDVNNAPRPDNWTKAVIATQVWTFPGMGEVRTRPKIVTFGKTLVKFLDDIPDPFKLELQLVNWLPYATVQVWTIQA